MLDCLSHQGSKWGMQPLLKIMDELKTHGAICELSSGGSASRYGRADHPCNPRRAVLLTKVQESFGNARSPRMQRRRGNDSEQPQQQSAPSASGAAGAATQPAGATLLPGARAC